MWKTTVTCVTLACLAAIAAPGDVAAKPLSPDECKARLTEHTDLVSKGAASLLEKEPDWVKSNMTEADLNRIKRLLEVEDDIRFRCQGVDVAGVTPGQLLGRKADDNDGAEGDSDSEPQEKAAKGKPVKAITGPDIPLPLRKPAPPKRADLLRFGNFGEPGRY